MRHLSVLVLLSLAIACNKEVTEPPPPATNTVTATANNLFVPPNAPVRQGGTITWQFLTVAHTVIFEGQAGAPDNIELALSNTTETRTFGTAGVYEYHCSVHPTMTGRITVIAP
jgi:plastocyanin